MKRNYRFNRKAGLPALLAWRLDCRDVQRALRCGAVAVSESGRMVFSRLADAARYTGALSYSPGLEEYMWNANWPNGSVGGIGGGLVDIQLTNELPGVRPLVDRFPKDWEGLWKVI